MGENFCLKWNDYDRNLSSTFCEIREDQELLDITLTCDDDKQLRAHKVILSACSPFFRNILRRNPHEHPLLYLRGVRYKELEAILHFIYNGEVNVGQDELNEFLLVAEDLKIKGLTQSNSIQEPQQLPKSKKENKPNIPNIISIASLKRNHESLSNSVPGLRSIPGIPVPAAGKRPKLSTLSNISNQKIEITNIISESDSIIVPSTASSSLLNPASLQANNNHQDDDDIADLACEDENDAEQFDESSIIEENYDEEEGEYTAELANSSEGYVGGSTEDYDQAELTESSYNTAASQGGGLAGNMGTESTSGSGSGVVNRGYVSCPVCAKLMYRKNLARHVAVKHTNAKPVQCTLCDKTMKNGWSLKEHERKYHGIFQSDKILTMENYA